MKATLFPVLLSCGLVARGGIDEFRGKGSELTSSEAPAIGDCLILPTPTNAVQFRLYTNASPDAPHVFNTFDIIADGQTLLQSPGKDALQSRQVASPLDASLHNILVNDAGPLLDTANSVTLLSQASGPDWQYALFDATAFYLDRLKVYRRGILFVEPDLFIVYDHIAAREPVQFKMLLHPPKSTILDTNWGDLRFDLSAAGFRVNAPSRQGSLRFWERIDSAADAILPGTVTMKLGPTNRVAELDLLTVFAVYPEGEKSRYDYYSFKLLESPGAVGARIHRAGLPTLVAFKTNLSSSDGSLHDFEFNGPVGVSVFRPKQGNR